jgi:hypothetical protein
MKFSNQSQQYLSNLLSFLAVAAYNIYYYGKKKIIKAKLRPSHQQQRLLRAPAGTHPLKPQPKSQRKPFLQVRLLHHPGGRRG